MTMNGALPLSTRLVQSASGISDSNGKLTLTLGPAALSEVWTGSVTIFGAPSGAQWTSQIGNTNWGTWAGPSNFGPVQLWSGESLVIKGTGLTPSTQYTVQMNGDWQPESSNIKPLGPVAPTSTVSVETTTALISNLVIPVGGSTTFTAPTLTRRLTIVFKAPNGNPYTLNITGNQTGAIYYNNTNIPGGSTAPFVDFAAIEPGLDATYTVNTAGGAGPNSSTLWLLASFTNPLSQIDKAVPISTISGNVSVINALGTHIIVTGPGGGITVAVDGNQAANLNSQILIPGPGAGNSAYIQSISCGNAAVANPSFFNVRIGGAGYFFIAGLATTDHAFASYPDGGFEVGSNNNVQADTGNNSVRWSMTYNIAAAI